MQAAKDDFELFLKIADAELLEKTKIWEWLEATCQAIGLQREAENYRNMKIDSSRPPRIN